MFRKLLTFCLLIFAFLADAQPEARRHMTSRLQEILNRSSENDSLPVSVSFSSSDTAKAWAKRYFLQQQSGSFLLYSGVVPVRHLRNLASSKGILLISFVSPAHEELTTGAFDLSLNRINAVHQLFPDLRGNGLSALIKERLLDTTDIDLSGRVFITGSESNNFTSHASLMATIVAGAANTSYEARGAADKARVGSTSFANLFPDPDSLIASRKISVVNHSYGTIIENFYGNEAAAYDAQAFRFPDLVNVFSSGNSGSSTPDDGVYKGQTNFANLTGNFKQAKNVITVGSIDSAGGLMPLSSNGPAYDGRIKPELMAYGEDGASGAAALVSGAVLLVQNSYGLTHNNNLPPSSLVRAVLANSAEDLDSPGPDFRSGFGKMNAKRAVLTVMGSRFFTGSILSNESVTIPLRIPAGLSAARITLAWTDQPADPLSPKALIQDLDLSATYNSQQWLPLSPDPRPSALLSSATQKRDTLNTIEQIVITQPVAGDYSIVVHGTRLTQSQSFSLAWQFDTAGLFQWTYPMSAPLISGKRYWLRWETHMTGSALLEYAFTGGNWQSLGSANLSSQYFQWSVPSQTGKAILRMNLPDGRQILSDSFAISPQPFLQTGFNCTDSFLLYCNRITPTFKIYELRNHYLEPFIITTDTALVLKSLSHPSSYFSVAPVVEGKEGVKSQTLNYRADAIGCYFRNFFLSKQEGKVAFFTSELGTLYEVKEIHLQKQVKGQWQTVSIISKPSSRILSWQDPALSQGVQSYRLELVTSGGTILYSNTETVFYVDAERPVVIYPNPVRLNEALKILISESGRFDLTLLDARGQILSTRSLNQTVTEIPASGLSRGVYFARIRDSRGSSFTIRFIIL